jgi:hypothetical protein
LSLRILRVVFRHACKLGLEGIVSKRKARPTAPAAAALILKRAPLARTTTRPGDIRRIAHGYGPTRRRLAFTGN